MRFAILRSLIPSKLNWIWWNELARTQSTNKSVETAISKRPHAHSICLKHFIVAFYDQRWCWFTFFFLFRTITMNSIILLLDRYQGWWYNGWYCMINSKYSVSCGPVFLLCSVSSEAYCLHQLGLTNYCIPSLSCFTAALTLTSDALGDTETTTVWVSLDVSIVLMKGSSVSRRISAPMPCWGTLQYNSSTRQISISPWKMMSLHLQANTTNIYKLSVQ